MKNLATLEGGPFDGVEVRWDGDLWMGDIIIGTPKQFEDDPDELYTGNTLHRYTCCNTTRDESGREWHYMGHVAQRSMKLTEVGEFFQSR